VTPGRLARAVAALLAVGLLVLWARSGTPAPPERADRVRLEITLRPDRSATVAVQPGGPDRPAVEVRDAALRVAAAMFPGRALPSARTRRVRGHVVAVATVRDAVPPGDPVVLPVPLGAARGVLGAYGWEFADVTVGVPDVDRVGATWTERPTERRYARWAWRGIAVQRLPEADVRLRPRPADGLAASAAGLVGVGAAWAGLSLWPRRRSRWRRLCGAGTVAFWLVAVLCSSSPDGDLGLGATAPAWVRAAAATLWAALPFALLAAVWLLLVPLPRVRRSAA
jgi:hypothetical protein